MSASIQGRAVVLKGPMPNSRSYVTAMPDSLELLLAKARESFPVPPDHTPHLTLGDDSGAILLPDALPFIRDRELLVFRWVANTPRSSLKNPRCVDQGSGGSSGSSGSSGSTSHGSRSVRWDASVVSNEGKTNIFPFRHNQQANGKGRALRKAHADRVFSEQQQVITEEEGLAKTSRGSFSPILTLQGERDANKTHSSETSNEPKEDLAQQKSCHRSDREGSRVEKRAPRGSSEEETTQEEHHDDSAVELCTPSPKESLQYGHVRLVTSASKLNRLHQNGISLTEEELELSSTQNPSCKTVSNPEDDQPSSSPLASPTRDVMNLKRSHKGGGMTDDIWQALDVRRYQQEPHLSSICDVTSSKATPSQEERQAGSKMEETAGDERRDQTRSDVEEVGGDKYKERARSKVEEMTSSNKHEERGDKIDETYNVEQDSHSSICVERVDDQDEAEREAVERYILGTSAKEKVRVKEDERREKITSSGAPPQDDRSKLPNYQMMHAVVNQLHSHPRNTEFRTPMSTAFERHSQDISRPLDLFIISQKIKQGEYGQEDATCLFANDLDQLWSNIKSYYGPESSQTRCAEDLARFSNAIMGEWRGASSRESIGHRGDDGAIDPKTRAVMTLTSFKTNNRKNPVSSLKKRPAQEQKGGMTSEEQQKHYANLIGQRITNKAASKAFVAALKQQELRRKKPRHDFKQVKEVLDVESTGQDGYCSQEASDAHVAKRQKVEQQSIPLRRSRRSATSRGGPTPPQEAKSTSSP